MFEKTDRLWLHGRRMLGVTYTLAHVTDKLGRQVGESMGTREGEPLARFLDTKYPGYARTTRKLFGTRITPPL